MNILDQEQKEAVRQEFRKTYYGLTISRWIVLSTSITLFICSMCAIGFIAATYWNWYTHALVVTIVNRNIFHVMVFYSIATLVTALLGVFASLRKDRHLLSCHTLLLWICMGSLAAVAFLAYKDSAWDLRTALAMKWRYELTPLEQHLIQENLQCCGYENSADHAMYMSHCSQVSLLQGCSSKLQTFEAAFLVKSYILCLVFVPVYIGFIAIGLYYSRPSRPWLGRHYSNCRSPSLEEEVVKHDHQPTDYCYACENWTF